MTRSAKARGMPSTLATAVVIASPAPAAVTSVVADEIDCPAADVAHDRAGRQARGGAGADGRGLRLAGDGAGRASGELLQGRRRVGDQVGGQQRDDGAAGVGDAAPQPCSVVDRRQVGEERVVDGEAVPRRADGLQSHRDDVARWREPQDDVRLGG